jgi:hypothetical protein
VKRGGAIRNAAVVDVDGLTSTSTPPSTSTSTPADGCFPPEVNAQGQTSTLPADDSSQVLVDGIMIVDVDLIVDRKRCRRPRRTTSSPPSRLDVDRCALRASTARQAVEVDGGVRRLRTASLPSTSTTAVKVKAQVDVHRTLAHLRQGSNPLINAF